MNPSKPVAEPILRRAAIGFSAILLLCWLVELLQVPHRFFDEAAGFNWFRVLFRTVVVMASWGWVHFTTKRLLKRLHHLEEFVLVCSWCRKFGHHGNWLAMEEYFGSQFHTKTSHGICPECAKHQFEDFETEFDEVRNGPDPAVPTAVVRASTHAAPASEIPDSGPRRGNP
jgi:hypothetical protein